MWKFWQREEEIDCLYCLRRFPESKLNARSLCEECEANFQTYFARCVEIIQESINLIEASPSVQTKVSRCEVIIQQCETLREYEIKGIPTIDPPPSEVLEVALQKREELLSATNTPWLETKADTEATVRVRMFWKMLDKVPDTGGFWSDRLKQYLDDPQKRLCIALDNLPLPGAFKEAILALRAIIRAKRKNKKEHAEELDVLYWLAVVRSFMLEYAPRLRQPGFNVFESIPAERIQTLPFSYQEMGHAKLALLNKTDCKWLAEAWGEPQTHMTLHALHQPVWDEYETKLVEKRSEETRGNWSKLLQHLPEENRERILSSMEGASDRRGNEES